MMTAHDMIVKFDQARLEGAIKMTVDYDAGHAYNGWTGPVWEELYNLEGEVDDEEWEEFQQHADEVLSEEDPGLLCPPETINDLALLNGEEPAIVADECAEYEIKSPEEMASYMEEFMEQTVQMASTEAEGQSRIKWYRFDLMNAYIEAVRAGNPPNLPARHGRHF